MTGSLSVRGDVLPIGGVSAKVEAAIEAGIKKVYIVGNRVRDSEEKELITDFTAKNGLPLLALIPYDDTVVKADRVGEAPFNYAKTSNGVQIIQDIGEKLFKKDI